MTRNAFLAITFIIWLYVEVSFSPVFSLLLICPLITFPVFSPSLSNVIVVCLLDCKQPLFLRIQERPEQSTEKVWNEAEAKRLGIDAKDTFFFHLTHLIRACEDHAFRARKTLTPSFNDFFLLILREKTDCFAIYLFPEICYCVLDRCVPAVGPRKQSVMKKYCHLIHSFIWYTLFLIWQLLCEQTLTRTRPNATE